MGIKDLNNFIRTHAPESFRLIKISDFKRKRIAIDATLFIYQSFSAAFTGLIKSDIKECDLIKDDVFNRKRDPTTGEYICPNYKKVLFYVFNRINGFVWEMYYHGITPIFVYDGEAIHEKNSFARERRKQVRVATAERIRSLRQQIADTPLLERGTKSYKDFIDLRKLLAQAPPVNPYKDFEQILSHIRDSLGAPTIKAPNEAEKFCAFLASSGIAAASYSTDTDSYVFGSPVVISSIDQETKNENYFKMVEQTSEENERTGDSTFVLKKQCSTHFSACVTPVIIHHLGLTHRQFVDFCIILGCDFNSRLPGIGPARAWKLVQEILAESKDSNRIIEKIAEKNPKLDWSVLCSERCREIFTSMKDCEDALEDLLRKSPDRAIFNVSSKHIKNTELKNCYLRYFLPTLNPISQAPDDTEYITA